MSLDDAPEDDLPAGGDAEPAIVATVVTAAAPPPPSPFSAKPPAGDAARATLPPPSTSSQEDGGALEAAVVDTGASSTATTTPAAAALAAPSGGASGLTTPAASFAPRVSHPGAQASSRDQPNHWTHNALAQPAPAPPPVALTPARTMPPVRSTAAASAPADDKEAPRHKRATARQAPPLAWLRSLGASTTNLLDAASTRLRTSPSFFLAGDASQDLPQRPRRLGRAPSQRSVSSATAAFQEEDGEEDAPSDDDDDGDAAKKGGQGVPRGAAGKAEDEAGGGGGGGGGGTALWRLWRLGKLVVSESRVVGTVSWGVYLEYVRHMGVASMLGLPVTVLVAQACYVASEWWLSKWARATPADQSEAK